MKKITFLLSLIITSSIYAQSLEMPNIPAEGVNYETSTLDAYLSVSTELLGFISQLTTCSINILPSRSSKSNSNIIFF